MCPLRPSFTPSEKARAVLLAATPFCVVTGSPVIFLTNFPEGATFQLQTDYICPPPPNVGLLSGSVLSSLLPDFPLTVQLLTQLPTAGSSLPDRTEIMWELWLGLNTYISLGISIKVQPLLLQGGWWEIIYPSWVVGWVVTKHRLFLKIFFGEGKLFTGNDHGCVKRATWRLRKTI